MKSIHYLIPDIYKLFGGEDEWFRKSTAADLSAEVAQRLGVHFNKNASTPTLRLSQMGPRCPKALWHSIHTPGEAERLPPWAMLKYAYGHILEALLLTLAKAAGHDVEGEQDEVVLDGIIGHRDAVIDGCVVDVKSASSRAFEKFKTGSIATQDSFGYLEQLDGYVTASFEDPLVTVKDRGYLLAIDKTLGHLCLYEHIARPEHIRSRIAHHKQVVGMGSPPPCECVTQADGKSGNVKLGTVASYSAFKHCCFPSLRTFLYASGPVYLTKVIRTPDVMEIDKHGRAVYN